jgi:hypothetical protein
MPSITAASGVTVLAAASLSGGALVAEDPGIAVLVGADHSADPEVGQQARQNLHRVLDPRVLRIRLDALELGLGAHALDFELRHEHRHLAPRALGEDDGALGREEAEAREVADVVLVEEDIAREALATHVIQQACAPGLQLDLRNAGARVRALLHL